MHKRPKTSVAQTSRSGPSGPQIALHPGGRSVLVVGALVGALSLGLAAPALAGPGDTTTTFALTGGSLAITVPGAATLSSSPTGATSTISGPLGGVAVTDARGGLMSTWTASVASSAFKTGAGSANETISNSVVTYAPNTAASTGTGVFTPGTGGAMTASQTAYKATGTVGNNSASWNPTISVAAPVQAVAGTYTATITHSVL